MSKRSILIVIASFLWADSQLKCSSLCAKVTTLEPDMQSLPRATLEATDLDDPSIRYIATTDREGRACLEKVPDGLYSVEASAGGFMHVRYYPVRVASPRNISLAFKLPFGEVREGGVGADVIVSGTLRQSGAPLDGVRICLVREDKAEVEKCTDTNDIGQYALVITPGKYQVEIRRLQETIATSTVEFPAPGVYRNRLSISSQ
jgi:hypothetical protein